MPDYDRYIFKVSWKGKTIAEDVVAIDKVYGKSEFWLKRMFKAWKDAVLEDLDTQWEETDLAGDAAWVARQGDTGVMEIKELTAWEDRYDH